MKPVAIYARVSTTKEQQEQSIEAQVETLKKYCEFRGWEAIVFSEQKSGMKDESKRPEMAKMMAQVRRGKFSGILVTQTSRFGRHPLENIKLWYELVALRVNFTAVEEGIDTTSPMGEAIFMLFSVLGKMQRDGIARSVRRGLDLARQKGKKFGRPEIKIDEKAVLEFKGSLRQAAAQFHVGKDKIAQIKKSAVAEMSH